MRDERERENEEVMGLNEVISDGQVSDDNGKREITRSRERGHEEHR